ncbi:MAG: hypothetical protein M1834_005712 [Cirrosporium novae-zelandiae]|nr:MAG: hypothetical protein M1834_005712 [Cirrosporium novae-zelandiae]
MPPRKAKVLAKPAAPAAPQTRSHARKARESAQSPTRRKRTKSSLANYAPSPPASLDSPVVSSEEHEPYRTRSQYPYLEWLKSNLLEGNLFQKSSPQPSPDRRARSRNISEMTFLPSPMPSSDSTTALSKDRSVYETRSQAPFLAWMRSVPISVFGGSSVASASSARDVPTRGRNASRTPSFQGSDVLAAAKLFRDIATISVLLYLIIMYVFMCHFKYLYPTDQMRPAQIEGPSLDRALDWSIREPLSENATTADFIQRFNERADIEWALYKKTTAKSPKTLDRIFQKRFIRSGVEGRISAHYAELENQLSNLVSDTLASEEAYKHYHSIVKKRLEIPWYTSLWKQLLLVDQEADLLKKSDILRTHYMAKHDDIMIAMKRVYPLLKMHNETEYWERKERLAHEYYPMFERMVEKRLDIEYPGKIIGKRFKDEEDEMEKRREVRETVLERLLLEPWQHIITTAWPGEVATPSA